MISMDLVIKLDAGCGSKIDELLLEGMCQANVFSGHYLRECSSLAYRLGVSLEDFHDYIWLKVCIDTVNSQAYTREIPNLEIFARQLSILAENRADLVKYLGEQILPLEDSIPEVDEFDERGLFDSLGLDCHGDPRIEAMGGLY